MNIRAVRPEDRAAIVRLIGAMGGHDDVLDDPQALRGLGAVIASPRARAFVAEVNGSVVGYAELHARAATMENREEAYLAALAVDEAHRSSGMGAALLQHCDGAAALMGCTHIVLNSSLMRERAHAFYRREGFDEMRVARRFVRSCRGELPCHGELVEPGPSLARGELIDRFLIAAARAASSVQWAIAGLHGAAPVGMGADGAQTEAADRAAEEAAVAALWNLGVPIVSEESGLIGDRRVNESAPWISLDPLDGSRNFVEGYPAYGTAMGLVVDGAPLAGYVADLVTGRRWWGIRGGGAWRDGERVRSRRGTLVAMPSPLPGSVIETPHAVARVRIAGSSALDLCRVADGSLAAFVVTDRPVVHVHDLAGPLALLLESGAVVRDLEGNVPTLIPDPAVTFSFIAAADAELAAALRPVLSS